jgi:hypothetical protein
VKRQGANPAAQGRMLIGYNFQVQLSDGNAVADVKVWSPQQKILARRGLLIEHKRP